VYGDLPGFVALYEGLLTHLKKEDTEKESRISCVPIHAENEIRPHFLLLYFEKPFAVFSLTKIFNFVKLPGCMRNGCFIVCDHNMSSRAVQSSANFHGLL